MGDSTEAVVLKVGGGSDPRAVGSAIAHSLAEGKQVTLRGVGAGAINQAVKAIAIATQWTAPRGYGLACIPGFEDIEGRDGGKISAVSLRIIRH
jgi:stage V sporulation protein S